MRLADQVHTPASLRSSLFHKKKSATAVASVAATVSTLISFDTCVLQHLNCGLWSKYFPMAITATYLCTRFFWFGCAILTDAALVHSDNRLREWSVRTELVHMLPGRLFRTVHWVPLGAFEQNKHQTLKRLLSGWFIENFFRVAARLRRLMVWFRGPGGKL